ncbi:glycosyl hydrolase family 28-related protein [Hymenobacter defluvii]|uniref:Right-handed parallel beta-helix repeat-containing protein n=1 Tax=Hymenobacter defluvii TaxID=2054411 RepID=A0ABS3TAR9_9BACT|nr:right-handed parallel beta-helix repeat-containing protein [Hymenobacter defluvii]MBO3270738.1 right-handed parallel beta-helix repeat-containing protein [Hymenobacter defluvii]
MLDRFVLLVITIASMLFNNSLVAQGVIKKDLRKDFGARGDGKTNDQVAFEKAAHFFNTLYKDPKQAATKSVLYIPKGIYIVGKQDSINTCTSCFDDANGKSQNIFYLNGIDLLNFKKCRNLTIIGQDSATTEIRYAAGLKYGSFDPKTGKPYKTPPGYFTDYTYAAKGGTCITLQECENVTVANLTVNGNSKNLIVGGAWGDTGIQLAFDGLFVSNSKNINVSNVSMHHLGRDGMQVLNHLSKTIESADIENIVVKNSSFNYNGRQGLSLTGVNGFKAYNSSFNQTGRVRNASTGRYLYSNPGAGVDLEPQDGFVLNVEFVNCQMINNSGQGMVSDKPEGNHPNTTKNIRVTGSTLWGVTNCSAWITQPGFSFKSCKIYGSFFHGCDAAREEDATTFEQCVFEDKAYGNRLVADTVHILSVEHMRKMRFTACRFISHRTPFLRIVPISQEMKDLPVFRECEFVYDNSQQPTTDASILAGGVFRGNTLFKDAAKHKGNARKLFYWGDSIRVTTTTLDASATMQLQAQNTSYIAQGNFTMGKATSVTVGNANQLTFASPTRSKAELHIGPTARMVVKSGGALEILPGMNVVIEGNLMVEDGAYVYIDPQAVVKTIGTGTVRISPKATKTKHPDFIEK